MGECSSGEVSTDGENSSPERRSKPHPPGQLNNTVKAELEGEESASLCERDYVFRDEVVDLNSSTDFIPPEGFFQSEGEQDMEDEDEVRDGIQTEQWGRRMAKLCFKLAKICAVQRKFIFCMSICCSSCKSKFLSFSLKLSDVGHTFFFCFFLLL